MANPFLTFLFTVTGSFLIWMVKGFKGKFDNVMVRIDERNSLKGTIRYFLGLGTWMLIAIVTTILLTKPTKTKTYRAVTNEKGEIIRIEEVK